MEKEISVRFQYDSPIDAKEFAKSLQDFAEMWNETCHNGECANSLKLDRVERGSIILNFIMDAVNTTDWLDLVKQIADGVCQFVDYAEKAYSVYKFLKKFGSFLKHAFKASVKAIEINRCSFEINRCSFNEELLICIEKEIEEIEKSRVKKQISIKISDDEKTYENLETKKVRKLNASESVKKKIMKSDGKAEVIEYTYSVKNVSWTEIKLKKSVSRLSK